MIQNSPLAPAPPAGLGWPSLLPWLLVGGMVAAGALLFYRGATRGRANRWFSSPLAGSVFALLALFAGAILEFKDERVLAAWPLSYSTHSPVSAPTLFWSLILLLLATGFFYNKASDRLRQESELERSREIAAARAATEESRRHTSDLIERLRTLPPEGFMRDFPRLCSAMMAAYSAAIVEETPEASRTAIRIALRTAAAMARSFDRGSGDERYSANVMRYFPAGELPLLEEWSDADWCLYGEGFRPAAIQGALVLDPALASFADTDDQVPGLQPIRIVIPDPPRDRPQANQVEGRLMILPGAGVAFYRGEPYQASDTWRIRENAGTDDFFLGETLLAQTETYFREGPGAAVRSFISFPLFEDPGEMRGGRVGVLNVESNEPRIFDGDDEQVRQFALAIAPVHFVIVSLLANLAESGGGSAT